MACGDLGGAASDTPCAAQLQVYGRGRVAKLPWGCAARKHTCVTLRGCSWQQMASTCSASAQDHTREMQQRGM